MVVFVVVFCVVFFYRATTTKNETGRFSPSFLLKKKFPQDFKQYVKVPTAIEY